MSQRLAVLLIAVGCGFLLLVPPGYFRYSTIGFDSERKRADEVLHFYFRLRWPGDGTFRIGTGEIAYSLDEDVDTLDLAGRLFENSQATSHRRAAFGFGYWVGPEGRETSDGAHRWARWVSLPAWLPAISLLTLGLLLYRNANKKTPHE